MHGYAIINYHGWKWCTIKGCFVPPGENYTLFSHTTTCHDVIDQYFLGLEAIVGPHEAIEGPIFYDPDVPF